MVKIVCRAGHNGEWTLAMVTKGADKAQICCVTPSVCTDTSYTPLTLVEAILKSISDHVRDVEGPVRGALFLPQVRELCQSTKDRLLAEATAEATG